MNQQYNAADPQSVARQQEKATLARKQELEDIRAMLETPAGIRFFRRMVREGKVFSTSMTGNSWTYFNEGARNLVNRYLADVTAVAPGKIILLLSQQQEKTQEIKTAE